MDRAVTRIVWKILVLVKDRNVTLILCKAKHAFEPFGGLPTLIR